MWYFKQTNQIVNNKWITEPMIYLSQFFWSRSAWARLKGLTHIWGLKSRQKRRLSLPLPVVSPPGSSLTLLQKVVFQIAAGRVQAPRCKSSLNVCCILLASILSGKKKSPLNSDSRRQRNRVSLRCTNLHVANFQRREHASSCKFTCQVDISTCVHPLQVVARLYGLLSGSV